MEKDGKILSVEGVWDEKTRMNTTNRKNPYFCMVNASPKMGG